LKGFLDNFIYFFIFVLFMIGDSIKRNLVSLPGLILADIAKSREENEEFKRTVKRLKKSYTIKALGSLYKKYGKKSTEDLNAAIDLIVDKFVQDYGLFREEFTNYFKLLHEAFEANLENEYKGLVGAEQLLTSISARAESHPGEFFIPGGAGKSFHKKFQGAMKLLHKELAKEFATSKGLASWKGNAAGFFSKFVSDRVESRNVARKANDLKNTGQVSKEITDHIAAELVDGVQPDFMMWLVKYITVLGKTETLEGEVGGDIQILLASMEKKIVGVVDAIVPFIVAVEKFKRHKGKIVQARNEFFAARKLLTEKISVDEEKSEAQVVALARSVSSEEQAFYESVLNTSSAAVQAEIEKVRKRELGQ
jgi:hypothetical protein